MILYAYLLGCVPAYGYLWTANPRKRGSNLILAPTYPLWAPIVTVLMLDAALEPPRTHEDEEWDDVMGR